MKLALDHNNIDIIEATPVDFLALLKPRVMSLVVFSGFAGLFLAPGVINPLIALTAILCIALGSGASGAINMWYDRDIDKIMKRTQARPIVSGKISPESALEFGIILASCSVILMAVAVNFLSALLLLAAILFYVFVYTIYLKRKTVQNIVIGGAAGSFPPLIGWAAVTNDISLLPILLFFIIFTWTPPHFWALALYRSDDYRLASIPMLPVIKGDKITKNNILAYSIIMVATSLMPCFFGFSGLLYMTMALIFGLKFIYIATKLFFENNNKSAPKLFGYSIIYLFLIFISIMVDNIFLIKIF